jgi:hypothetical protein
MLLNKKAPFWQKTAQKNKAAGSLTARAALPNRLLQNKRRLRKGYLPFLFFLSWVRFGLVCQPKQVINTGIVKFRQLYQRIGRNIPLAQLISGITYLRAM